MFPSGVGAGHNKAKSRLNIKFTFIKMNANVALTAGCKNRLLFANIACHIIIMRRLLTHTLHTHHHHTHTKKEPQKMDSTQGRFAIMSASLNPPYHDIMTFSVQCGHVCPF